MRRRARCARAGRRQGSPMIAYDPKCWLRVLFSVHGTVLPRILVRIGLFTLLTAGVLAWDRLVAPLTPLDPLGHSLLGVAMGMLIVLRTNGSYDRWWEGQIGRAHV